MAYTVEQFLEKIKPYVIADMKSSKILASLTAAQALIESKHGDSGLTVKANNLFGIKGNYKGQSVKMWTTEYYNGKAQKVLADFRKYPSWAESIADHSAMFNRMSRYANLRGCTDYKTACKNVEKDGYATAIDPKTGKPNYANTLLNAIEKNHLYEWDKEVLQDGVKQEDNPNRNPYNEPTKNVRLNSKGNDVRWVQYYLNKAGHHLTVDGICGLKTVDAIKKFQFSHGLVVDGIVGEKTRAALKR